MCTNRNKEINDDTNVWSNGRAQKKEQMKEDYITWSNGRVELKQTNQ